MSQTTKNEFTPGPWSFDAARNWVGHRWKCSVRGGQSGSSIAEVYLGGETGLSCDADLVTANAQLIAAAPEMLAALEAIEELDDDPAAWDRYCSQVRGAIRKARGVAGGAGRGGEGK